MRFVSHAKDSLLRFGVALMEEFCGINGLVVPEVLVRSRTEWMFDACAFYRPTRIEICVEACAHVGTIGRAWSFPGNTVDRTPYGVIQHELGHHVDIVKSGMTSGYRGEYSVQLRAEVKEKPLTSYCPNDAEWFAEMFRLFVTNPDLLAHVRPETHARLRQDFQPAINVSWEQALQDAPERTIQACRNKVNG